MRELRAGGSGEDVRDWQRFLGREGLDPGTPDGAFGPRTEAATRGFQKRAGLTESGVVDAATLARAVAAGFTPAPAAGEPTLDAPSGGLLAAAFEAGRTAPLQWVEVTVGALIVTVASDAMKAPLLGREWVRLPVSYRESIGICRALDCVAPTRPICDAMFSQAKARLDHVGLVFDKKTEKRMKTVDFTLRFDDGVERQLAGRSLPPDALVFGAWKLWILHAGIARRGAVNYGFWDLSKHPPVPIQDVGERHNAAHYDYSQLLQPVRRRARRADTGAPVDLLDAVGPAEHVPARYVEAYRT